jgi:predicted component of type VI protein secretion system
MGAFLLSTPGPAAMLVTLVVERNRRRLKEIRLTAPEVLVGRGKGCPVRIPSAEVSRRHCRIYLEDGLVYAEDLDSVNGTRINGKPVAGKDLVRPGDHLEIGPVTFVVEYELTPDVLARLRGDAEEILEEGDALAPLKADEDLEPEEGPVMELEPVDLDVADFELPLDDDEPPAKPQRGGRKEEEAPAFSFEGPWQAPEGGNLRDILADLDKPSGGDRDRKKKK